MTQNQTVVVAYDGSAEARHAIDAAAQLLGPRRVDVGNGVVDDLTREERTAEDTADEGARIARDAGFDAHPVAVKTFGPVDAALTDYVAKEAPALVVVGTRGLSGVRSTILGSVSHHVAQRHHHPGRRRPHGALPELRRRDGGGRSERRMSLVVARPQRRDDGCDRV
jgi:nucleotide-binding universal stress UspA family protein